MLLIVNSYRRCSSIILTRDCAALTLLDSNSPEAMVTVSSVLALPPLFRRSSPSGPFCKSFVAGLTNLMRSTCDCAAALKPSGPLHGDETLAIDRDIERAARIHHDAAGKIRARIACNRIDPARKAGSIDRLAGG